MNNKIRHALLVMPIAMSMAIGSAGTMPVHAAGESAFDKLRENFNQMTDNYGKTGVDNNDKGYQTFNNNASANAKASQQQLKQQQKDLNSYYTDSVKNMDSKVNGGNGTARAAQQAQSSDTSSNRAEKTASNTASNQASSGSVQKETSSSKTAAANADASNDDVSMYSEGAQITSAIAETVFGDGEEEERTQAEKTVIEAARYADLQNIAIADAKDYQAELQKVEAEAKQTAIKEQQKKKEDATASFDKEKSNTASSFNEGKNNASSEFTKGKEDSSSKFSTDKDSAVSQFKNDKSGNSNEFNSKKNEITSSFENGKSSNSDAFNKEKQKIQQDMDKKTAEAKAKFSSTGGYSANMVSIGSRAVSNGGLKYASMVGHGDDTGGVPESFTNSIKKYQDLATAGGKDADKRYGHTGPETFGSKVIDFGKQVGKNISKVADSFVKNVKKAGKEIIKNAPWNSSMYGTSR